MRQLLRRHGRLRGIVTDNAAQRVEHRQHKGLNNRAENPHQSIWMREKVTRRFKSACQLQRLTSVRG